MEPDVEFKKQHSSNHDSPIGIITQTITGIEVGQTILPESETDPKNKELKDQGRINCYLTTPVALSWREINVFVKTNRNSEKSDPHSHKSGKCHKCLTKPCACQGQCHCHKCSKDKAKEKNAKPPCVENLSDSYDFSSSDLPAIRIHVPEDDGKAPSPKSKSKADPPASNTLHTDAISKQSQPSTNTSDDEQTTADTSNDKSLDKTSINSEGSLNVGDTGEEDGDKSKSGSIQNPLHVSQHSKEASVRNRSNKNANSLAPSNYQASSRSSAKKSQNNNAISVTLMNTRSSSDPPSSVSSAPQSLSAGTGGYLAASGSTGHYTQAGIIINQDARANHSASVNQNLSSNIHQAPFINPNHNSSFGHTSMVNQNHSSSLNYEVMVNHDHGLSTNHVVFINPDPISSMNHAFMFSHNHSSSVDHVVMINQEHISSQIPGSTTNDDQNASMDYVDTVNQNRISNVNPGSTSSHNHESIMDHAATINSNHNSNHATTVNRHQFHHCWNHSQSHFNQSHNSSINHSPPKNSSSPRPSPSATHDSGPSALGKRFMDFFFTKNQDSAETEGWNVDAAPAGMSGSGRAGCCTAARSFSADWIACQGHSVDGQQTQHAQQRAEGPPLYYEPRIRRRTLLHTYWKVLLKGVSGVARSGCMMAVIGPRGSGKTSLLKVLSGQRMRGRSHMTGDLHVNGVNVKDKLQHLAAFVPKDDVFVSKLTFKETLLFWAALKLEGLSAPERSKRVQDMLTFTLLSHRAHDLVASYGEDSSSSQGEMKLLSLACRLMNKPPVVCVDEPLCALGTGEAVLLLDVLQRLAARQHLVLCALHRPLSSVYRSFSQVLWLCNGRLVFLGSKMEALEMLATLGRPCPPLSCPADHCLTVLATHGTGYMRRFKAENLKLVFSRTSWSRGIQGEIAILTKRAAPLTLAEMLKLHQHSPAPYRRQLSAHLKCCWLRLARGTWLRYLLRSLFLSLCLGSLLLGVGEGDSPDASGSLMALLTSALVTAMVSAVWLMDGWPLLLVRDYDNGLSTRASPLFLAICLTQTFLDILTPFVLTSVTYPMIGLRPGFPAFFIALGVILLAANVSVGYGQWVSLACWPECASFWALVMWLLAGFPLSLPGMHEWISWLSHVSWPRHAMELLMVNQWSGGDSNDTFGDCNMTGGELRRYGYSPDNALMNWLSLAGLAVLMRLLTFRSFANMAGN